jgi:hypothetical protein
MIYGISYSKIFTNNNENYIKTECFICLEIIEKDKLIQLDKLEGYLKRCTCFGWVHRDCLNNWYRRKLLCPICRDSICIKETFASRIMRLSKKKLTETNFFIIYIYKVFYNAMYFLLFIISFSIILGGFINVVDKVNNLYTNENKNECENQIEPQEL